MSAPPNALNDFIAQAKADLTSEGGIRRFELYHTVEAEMAERLLVVQAENEVDEILASVWATAEEDASTRQSGQPQRYSLHAYRKDRHPDRVHSFVIRSSFPSVLTHGDTEPATEKGERAHYMRHDENLHRLVMNVVGESAVRQQRELENMTKRANSAEEKVMQMFTLQQDLLDRKHEREIEAAREVARARRHDEMMGMLMGMAPLLISKFMGAGGVTPTSQSVRDTAIGKFLKGLSQEEAMKIFQSLKPGNQLVLAELYQSYADDDKKDQEKKPAILRDPAPEEQPNGQAKKEAKEELS